MPGSKLEPIRRYFEALGRGDAPTAFEGATEDFLLDMTRSQAPWRGVYRTKVEALRIWERVREAWTELRWDLLEMRPVGGGRVAVRVRAHAAGFASGVEVDARGGWLVTMRGDLVSEAALYQTFEEALAGGRRATIADARLYFVCEARPQGADPRRLLDAALRGGADLIQLRDKRLGDPELIEAAKPFRDAADEHGALFILNDRPDLVSECEADGVHVGQGDVGVAEARRTAGPGAVVGLSTHTAAEIDTACAAGGDDRPDQISVGPVWETPTKQGRPAAGLELVEHAARAAGELPWFAIGGIDASNVAEVTAAGARRIVVVRAIRDAPDPEAAAQELRAALD